MPLLSWELQITNFRFLRGSSMCLDTRRGMKWWEGLGHGIERREAHGWVPLTFVACHTCGLAWKGKGTNMFFFWIWFLNAKHGFWIWCQVSIRHSGFWMLNHYRGENTKPQAARMIRWCSCWMAPGGIGRLLWQWKIHCDSAPFEAG